MEGTIMPLNLADFNKKYRISKVCGQEKQRHYLESLGFICGSEVELLSEIHGYYIVMVKGSKTGLKRVWQSESSCTPLKPEEAKKNAGISNIQKY